MIVNILGLTYYKWLDHLIDPKSGVKCTHTHWTWRSPTEPDHLRYDYVDSVVYLPLVPEIQGQDS